jgi:uncharacterized protein
MSLKTKISDDIKSAMKAKDKVRLAAVRSIKKVILEKEVEARVQGRDELTAAEEVELLVQQAKQRRDSIEQYGQAGRDDLVEQEAQELAIIEEYLPKQLTDAEVSAVIAEIVSQVGATSAKDIGKVMGPAMQRLKGQADGKKVQALVQETLKA